jgi:hypothetical protein
MIECKHRSGNTCLIATDLVTAYHIGEAVITTGACERCVQSSVPQEVNDVTASLAVHAARTVKGVVPRNLLTELKPLFRREVVPLEAGPGTELARILWWFDHKKGCRCKSRERMMNLWGPSLCEARTNTIIGWLKAEASRRGLPFSKTVARHYIDKAIRRARRGT